MKLKVEMPFKMLGNLVTAKVTAHKTIINVRSKLITNLSPTV